MGMPHKLSEEKRKRIGMPKVPAPGTLHTYFERATLPLDVFQHRNVAMDKIVSIYCLYLQRLRRFEKCADVVMIENHFAKFVAMRALGKKAKFETKLYFFFQAALSSNRYSIKMFKTEHGKYKSCAHDKCKKKGRRVEFRL